MTNDTGLHPTDGYVLAEFIELEDKGMIKIPDKYKNSDRDETKQKIVVLEDSRGPRPMEDPVGLGYLSPGTRILTTAGDGIMHRGRKLLLIKYEDIKAWYDPEPVGTTVAQAEFKLN